MQFYIPPFFPGLPPSIPSLLSSYLLPYTSPLSLAPGSFASLSRFGWSPSIPRLFICPQISEKQWQTHNSIMWTKTWRTLSFDSPFFQRHQRSIWTPRRCSEEWCVLREEEEVEERMRCREFIDWWCSLTFHVCHQSQKLTRATVSPFSRRLKKDAAVKVKVMMSSSLWGVRQKIKKPLTGVRGRGHSSHLVCRTSGFLLLSPPPPSPSHLHGAFLFRASSESHGCRAQMLPSSRFHSNPHSAAV